MNTLFKITSPFLYDRKQILELLKNEPNFFSDNGVYKNIKMIKSRKVVDDISTSLNLCSTDVREMIIAKMDPGYIGGIHNDGNYRHLCILIPVTTCENVWFSWWQLKQNAKSTIIPNFPLYNNEPFEFIKNTNDTLLIDKIKINTSIIADIHKFHNICNLGDEMEIVLSIRFNINDTYNKEHKYTENFEDLDNFIKK